MKTKILFALGCCVASLIIVPFSSVVGSLTLIAGLGILFYYALQSSVNQWIPEEKEYIRREEPVKTVVKYTNIREAEEQRYERPDGVAVQIRKVRQWN